MAHGKSVLVCLSIGSHLELPFAVMQWQTLLPSSKYLSLSVKVPSGSLLEIAVNDKKLFLSQKLKRSKFLDTTIQQEKTQSQSFMSLIRVCTYNNIDFDSIFSM
jgi:hypothetical protein